MRSPASSTLLWTICLSNSLFSWRHGEVLAVHPEDPEDILPFSAQKKDPRNNQYGILFSFEPRRKLPDNLRSVDLAVLLGAQHRHQFRHRHLERRGAHPTFEMAEASTQPRVHQLERCVDSANGLLLQREPHSNEAAVKSAAQFAGVQSPSPLCIGGVARLRQHHCVIPRGGTYADVAASHYYDCIHAKDGRWKLRSSIAVPSYLGMFW